LLIGRRREQRRQRDNGVPGILGHPGQHPPGDALMEKRPRGIHAGRATLADADDHLSDDDFDGACRRYLLAAWCFGRAAGCAGVSAE